MSMSVIEMLEAERNRRAIESNRKHEEVMFRRRLVDPLHAAYAAIESELAALKLLGDYGRGVSYAACQARTAPLGTTVCNDYGLRVQLGPQFSRTALSLVLNVSQSPAQSTFVLTREANYPYQNATLETLDAFTPAATLLGALMRHLMPDVVMEPSE